MVKYKGNIKITLAKELETQPANDTIWELAMVIRELSTFNQIDTLKDIYKLNEGGYNHIVVEPQENGYGISRTAIMEPIAFAKGNATVMDLIHFLSGAIAKYTEA